MCIFVLVNLKIQIVKNYVILGVMLVLNGVLPCAGQVVGRGYAFPAENGSDFLIQSVAPSGHDLVYFREEETQKHVFLYPHFDILNINTSTYFKYTLPLVSNQVGGYSYTVNDMQVVGNACFFCGKMREPIGYHAQIGGGWIFDYRETGYIARMSLNRIDVLAPAVSFPPGTGGPIQPEINVKFSLIEKTREIWKMDIATRSTDTLIAMIAQSSEALDCSSLVAMNGGGSSWSYLVHKINDNQERLTDVAFGGKYLVTASRFAGAHRSFGLRYVYIEDLFDHHNITQYCNRNRFNTDAMETPWRIEEHPIKLVTMPGGNDVTVAYEGINFLDQQDSTNYNRGLALFYINGSNPYNITMTAARKVSLGTSYTQEFRAMQYVPYLDAIALKITLPVSPSIGYFWSVVEFFKWNTYTIPSCFSHQDDAEAMDVMGNKISLVGKSIVTGHPFRVYTDLNYLDNISGCLWEEINNSEDIELDVDKEEDDTNDDISEGNNIWIISMQVNPTKHSYGDICTVDGPAIEENK